METLLQASTQGILIGAVYAAIALGFSVVYSVSGVVNFAHGDFLVLGMYVVLSIAIATGIDPYLTAPVVVVVMGLLGALVWQFLIKRVARSKLILVAQLTLGISFVIQSLLLIVFGPNEQRVRSVLTGSTLEIGFLNIEWTKLVAFAVAAALSVLFFVMAKRTDFGRAIRAIHQNQTAAVLVGLRVSRIQLATFALGIAIVGLGASVMVPISDFNPSMGFSFTIIVFIAVALGGMDDYIGVLIGGLIVGVAESIGGVYLPGNYGEFLPFVALLAILLFRPAGILKGRNA